MKAYELQEASGLGGLRLIEKPEPTPDFGEVLVRIQAVTLNYRDLLTIKGMVPGRNCHLFLSRMLPEQSRRLVPERARSSRATG